MKAPTYEEALGEEIRRARKDAGLDQAQLCARLRRRHVKIQQPMLSRYERGIFAAPSATVEAIERELGLGRWELFMRASADPSSRRGWSGDTPDLAMAAA